MASIYDIALAMTPGIGNASCRKLMEICPSAEDLFALSHSQLKELFGNHTSIISAIENRTSMARAEEEMQFVERYNLRVLFFTDPDYPQRLNREECTDSPALIYVKGDTDLNPEHSVSIVGTRRATAHGRENTSNLVRQLKPYSTHIISGLAYGIDTAAHTAALENDLPTVAVLGHGLDRIYPVSNRTLAKNILDNGGALLTEYTSGTALNPRYFPARNRIIAALGDATVVVEAATKGGALITAAIAASYHRDVYAIPGRLSDTYSAGTNSLIATNHAILMRSADDIAMQLGWPITGCQTALLDEPEQKQLSPAERHITELLGSHMALTLDQLVELSNMPMPKVASILFNLETIKVIRILPGRLYELCKG